MRRAALVDAGEIRMLYVALGRNWYSESESQLPRVNAYLRYSAQRLP